MIRNHLQEQTKINSVFLPLSRAEDTFLSAVIDSLDSGQPRCEAGMGVFHFGDDTGSATGLAGTITLQDCATSDGTFVDVEGAVHTITALPTAAGWVVEIPFSPAAIRRYRKWEIVLDFTAGSTPAVPCSGIEILSMAQQEPIS